MKTSSYQDVINDIANRVFARHNKSVYDALAIRRLAEQIDTLYWDAGAPDISGSLDVWNDDRFLKKNEDLSDEQSV